MVTTNDARLTTHVGAVRVGVATGNPDFASDAARGRAGHGRSSVRRPRRGAWANGVVAFSIESGVTVECLEKVGAAFVTDVRTARIDHALASVAK